MTRQRRVIREAPATPPAMKAKSEEKEIDCLLVVVSVI
jgi:hypothetical protein